MRLDIKVKVQDFYEGPLKVVTNLFSLETITQDIDEDETKAESRVYFRLIAYSD